MGLRISYRDSEIRGREPLHEPVVGEIDPELLLLAHVGGGEPRSTHYTGTKALMMAILEDAIRNYLGRGGRLRTEAEYWVTIGSRRSPFSFTVVCETLGLEPDAARAALKRMRSQNMSPRRVLGRSRPNVRRTTHLVGWKAG